jgi:hypothetical protein
VPVILILYYEKSCEISFQRTANLYCFDLRQIHAKASYMDVFKNVDIL